MLLKLQTITSQITVFSEVLVITQLYLTTKVWLRGSKRAVPLTADRVFAQNCLSSLLKPSFPSHLLKHPNPQLLDYNQNDEESGGKRTQSKQLIKNQYGQLTFQNLIYVQHYDPLPPEKPQENASI